MKRKKNALGFTLLELLIVISIVAILAALLLPALNSARKKAQSINCLSNQKQLGIATAQYVQDNDDCLPVSHSVNGISGSGKVSWATLLYISITGEKLERGNQYLEMLPGDLFRPANPMFACPAVSEPFAFKSIGNQHFGINYFMIDSHPYYQNNRYLTRLQRPSERLLYADMVSKVRYADFLVPTTGYSGGHPAYRHPGLTANFTFADLHTVNHREYYLRGGSWNSWFWGEGDNPK